MQLGDSAQEVPQEHRELLKKSLNTFSVDYYWGGEVREALAKDPSILD